ncbi:MAG: exodeoxyribonuclease VII small subunit [Ruminococcus sp.]|nr:exodeoxyribonuclease VII small subunit [Ruminococcus sp.]
MTFEEKMERLAELVRLLENDKLPIDESMEYYKEGVMLSKECKKTLDEAKLRVTTMRAENESGDGDMDNE